MAFAILRVKIRRFSNSSGTHYTYPASYDATKIRVLVYETQMQGGLEMVAARGGTDEYLLGLVDQAHASAFTVSPDIVAITRTEAESFLGSTELNRYTEKIVDERALLLLMARVLRGETLTQDERNSLDSSRSGGLIIRSSTLQSVLDGYGV